MRPAPGDVARPTPLSTADGGQHPADVDNTAEPTVDIGLDRLNRARRAARPGRAAPAGPSASAVPAAAPPVAQGRGPRRRKPAARDDAWSGAAPDRRDPQAVGDVAAGLFAERGWERPLSESRVLADWPTLVGPQIARVCTPTALRDGELRISAASTAWATQLRLLAPTLLARIAEQVGAGVVTSLVISGPTAPSWKHGPRVFRGRGPRDTYG